MPRREVFTTEVRENVRQWVQDGESAEVIAQRLGSTPGTVRVFCSRNGIRFQDYEGEVALSKAAFRAFSAAAFARKIKLSDMVRRFLDAAAGDRWIIDNVMDDLPRKGD